MLKEVAFTFRAALNFFPSCDKVSCGQ